MERSVDRWCKLSSCRRFIVNIPSVTSKEQDVWRKIGKYSGGKINIFWVVYNSSIGDLVPSLVGLLVGRQLTLFGVFSTLQSDPREVWPLRPSGGLAVSIWPCATLSSHHPPSSLSLSWSSSSLSHHCHHCWKVENIAEKQKTLRIPICRRLRPNWRRRRRGGS